MGHLSRPSQPAWQRREPERAQTQTKDRDLHTVDEPMVTAVDEAARVRAVEDLGLLETGAEERFDRITRLAR